MKERINRKRLQLRDMSIGKKLIVSGYMIMTPILLLISMVVGIHNYRSVKESDRNRHLQTAGNINESITMLMGEMEDICTYISVNTNINRLLTDSNAYNLNTDSQVWTNHAPMRMIEDMATLKSYIKSIAMYPENGLRPYLHCMDGSSQTLEVGKIRRSPMYQQAIRKRGRKNWTTAGKNGSMLYQNNRKKKLVLYREIYNLSKSKRLAFMAIGADITYFEDLCKRSIDTEQEGVLVINDEGAELLKVGRVPQKVSDYVATNRYLLETENVCDYDNSMVYRVGNEKNGVYVCLIEQEVTLRQRIGNVLAEPVALLVGFLIGLFPILLLISRVVTMPLKRLQYGMDQFKKGDFEHKIPVDSQDEMGQTAACFNEMVDEIHALINKNYVMALKEKESELTALQAQINPHFLYNTLDALYWQAQNTDNEELAEDILALSNLFRMVLGQGKGVVTVDEEIGLVNEYLRVQKMRFERKLNYEIVEDPDVKGIEIPKLILQPFVENAIVHGFEKQQEGCKIRITVGIDGKYVKFTVSDTGAGMTEEQIASIFREDEKKRYSGQRVGRYAVKNVKERLTLKYHDNFLLDIKSEIGKGTQVIIQIPCDLDTVETENSGNSERTYALQEGVLYGN